MLVTELGIVTDVNPLQFWKAHGPMLVTELGMVSVPVAPLHPVKAPSPILMTEFGIVMDVKLEQL